ncbi:hypothetical protein [Ornithinimicrobium avium]|uniref:Uncharacterized protein n=1 Tax=Ornithinimicrobium avium TaxID=2283195 RepID=A0A345NPV2_9MICO|nr:hypothetical protein [Ornithinimicrobium avium]AXH97060.1 hypothetical protein DV701_13855 [Ornithinimicrobium avium]
MRWDHSAPVTRAVALRLAEEDLPAQALSSTAAAFMDSGYGITNPDLLAQLLPSTRATYQTLRGLPHDQRLVDPIVRRQIRHTLALDREDPPRAGHIIWELDGHHRAAT